jgi:hypothetical protein
MHSRTPEKELAVSLIGIVNEFFLVLLFGCMFVRVFICLIIVVLTLVISSIIEQYGNSKKRCVLVTHGY